MLKKSTYAEVATKSPNIVLVQCLDKIIEWNKTRTSVHTYYKFKIIDLIKGEDYFLNEEIVYKHLGGSLGSITIKAPAAPSFIKNSHYMLCLDRKNSSESVKIYGYLYGILPVDKDKEGDFFIKTVMLKSLLKEGGTVLKTTYSIPEFKSLIKKN